MLIALLQIVGGFMLLVWGADRLVAGASGLASNFGLSPLIIGLTIIGFGTSAPELVVSAVASLRGNPGIAVGNALGSNITNIGLVLGATALLYPLRIDSITLRREAPVLLMIMLLSTWLLWDLNLGKKDGLILILGLLAMLAWMVWLGLRRGEQDPLVQELEAEIPTNMPISRTIIWTLIGLIVLPLSSRILVDGAVTVATTLGISDTIIGLTIIALGTSLPELAAAMASAMKNEHDLAVGNILGSNMFNLLGVLGIAALVHPLDVSPVLLSRDVLTMFLLTGALFILAMRKPGANQISRRGGLLLFAGFVIYTSIVIYSALQGGT